MLPSTRHWTPWRRNAGQKGRTSYPRTPPTRPQRSALQTNGTCRPSDLICSISADEHALTTHQKAEPCCCYSMNTLALCFRAFTSRSPYGEAPITTVQHGATSAETSLAQTQSSRNSTRSTCATAHANQGRDEHHRTGAYMDVQP